mmetsp:Transcript_24542/g.44391  ORF Transcript_24542/g.44391 Transcript_24542/m.44391 type:complete len:81 (+) Transcript_24542:68-310(+)
MEGAKSANILFQAATHLVILFPVIALKRSIFSLVTNGVRGKGCYGYRRGSKDGTRNKLEGRPALSLWLFCLENLCFWAYA